MSFNLSSWSIRNPTPGILLFVLLTIAGLMGFAVMKVQAFPDMTLPVVTITASLPGASPSQLESEVARKIENALATVQGVKHISSTLGESTANIAVSFQLEKPPQEAVEDVRDAVARVRSDLPADLRDPVIEKAVLAETPILTYTVASPRMDEEALSWFVDHQLSKTLLAVPGVGAVSRVGGVTREVRVELDPARLMALKASAADISRQLARCSRRPQAAAPIWAAPSSRFAPLLRCRRPRSWRRSSWCSAMVGPSGWTGSQPWSMASPTRAPLRGSTAGRSLGSRSPAHAAWATWRWPRACVQPSRR